MTSRPTKLLMPRRLQYKHPLQHPLAVDLRHGSQIVCDLVAIGRRIDHEFDLVSVFGDQPPNDLLVW